MSVVTIYGPKISTCVRRTAAVLNAIGQPYVVKELDWFKGEYKTPEHYNRHPFGRVPVIEFEGLTLYGVSISLAQTSRRWLIFEQSPERSLVISP